MKHLLSAIILLSATTAITASDRGDYNPTVTHDGSTLSVDMTLRLADVKVKSEQQLTVTPALVNGDNRLDLPDVTVTGRSRSIRDARQELPLPAGFASYRA